MFITLVIYTVATNIERTAAMKTIILAQWASEVREIIRYVLKIPTKPRFIRTLARRGPCGCRSFILGVNPCCVHRNQSKFGSESGKNKKESEPEPERIQFVPVCHKVCKRKVPCFCILQGKTQEKNADKHKSNADGTDENIFPGSLKGQLIPVMIDQQ